MATARARWRMAVASMEADEPSRCHRQLSSLRACERYFIIRFGFEVMSSDKYGYLEDMRRV
jgi:hypothetical protein